MSSKAINFTTHEVIAWRSLTRGVLFHPLEPQPAYHKRRRLSWDWSPPRSKDSPEQSGYASQRICCFTDPNYQVDLDTQVILRDPRRIATSRQSPGV